MYMYFFDWDFYQDPAGVCLTVTPNGNVLPFSPGQYILCVIDEYKKAMVPPPLH